MDTTLRQELQQLVTVMMQLLDNPATLQALRDKLGPAAVIVWPAVSDLLRGMRAQVEARIASMSDRDLAQLLAPALPTIDRIRGLVAAELEGAASS